MNLYRFNPINYHDTGVVSVELQLSNVSACSSFVFVYDDPVNDPVKKGVVFYSQLMTAHATGLSVRINWSSSALALCQIESLILS